MDAYVYTRLDLSKKEIRLVDLLPSSTNDPIRISIRHVSFDVKGVADLDDDRKLLSLDELQATLPDKWKAFETLEHEYIFEHQETEDTTWTHPDSTFDCSKIRSAERNDGSSSIPNFEALSYTWGTASVLVPIVVKTIGSSSEQIAQVGTNLAAALKHLRYSDRTRTMWIDSLCIDQSSLAERSHQVQLMADIYRLASRVVIWLGDKQHDSDHAINTLNTLGQQLELTIYGSKLLGSAATQKEWFRGSHSLPYDDRTWTALSHLLERPWFRRLWVVQEFHLANNHSIVQCGHATITKPLFRRALGCLNDKRQFPSGNIRELLNRVESFIFDISQEPLDMLIWTYTDRLCTDPRDKVYGLLGLASAELAAKILPDYALPVEEVYKQVYLAIVGHFGRLDHIRSMLEPSQCADRPSWVLDLAAEIDHPRTSWQFCSGLSAAETKFLSPDILEVTGVRCAIISTIVTPCPRDDFPGAFKVIQEWMPTEDEEYITGESRMDAFVSCLRYNLFRERMPVTALPTLAGWRKRVENEIIGKEYDPKMAKDLEIWYSLRNCGNKVFVSTAEGYFGICTVGVEKGDVICVLLGSSAPVVLRPTPHGYHVIGDCYLHGLNDATALLGPLPKPWRVILIRITAYSYRYVYLNSETREQTIQDPRLPSLGPEWEHIPSTRTKDDPKVYERFRNVRTGDVVNSDPRLRAEALEERGVGVERFRLV